MLKRKSRWDSQLQTWERFENWWYFDLWREVNQVQSWISLEMSEPPPLCTPNRKGDRASKFSVESVWKCQGREEEALTFPDWFKNEFGCLSPFLSGVQSGGCPDISRLIQDWIWFPLTLPVRCAERRRPWLFQTDSRLNLVTLSPFLSCVQRGGGPDISRLIQDWIWLTLYISNLIHIWFALNYTSDLSISHFS